MKVIREIATPAELRDMVWAGAIANVAELTDDELQTVMDTLEECCPEGLTEMQLNDFFWFDRETYLDWLGLTEDEVDSRGPRD